MLQYVVYLKSFFLEGWRFSGQYFSLHQSYCETTPIATVDYEEIILTTARQSYDFK